LDEMHNYILSQEETHKVPNKVCCTTDLNPGQLNADASASLQITNSRRTNVRSPTKPPIILGAIQRGKAVTTQAHGIMLPSLLGNLFGKHTCNWREFSPAINNPQENLGKR
jgi:hypothetical protein